MHAHDYGCLLLGRVFQETAPACVSVVGNGPRAIPHGLTPLVDGASAITVLACVCIVTMVDRFRPIPGARLEYRPGVVRRPLAKLTSFGGRSAAVTIVR